jgi:hypothetical protein
MKWKQIKPDASGAVALFVGGAVLLLLTFLSLPSHQIRLGRGGPDLSREAHPFLYWTCEIVIILVGVLCVVFSVRLSRALIRQQREQERNLEQKAVDSFTRKHEADRQ